MNSMSTAQGDFLFEVFNRLKDLEGQLAKEEVSEESNLLNNTVRNNFNLFYIKQFLSIKISSILKNCRLFDSTLLSTKHCSLINKYNSALTHSTLLYSYPDGHNTCRILYLFYLNHYHYLFSRDRIFEVSLHTQCHYGEGVYAIREEGRVQ